MSFEINVTNATVKIQIEDQTESILSLEQLSRNIKELASDLFEQWIRYQQEVCLNKSLGQRWKRLNSEDINCGCPHCGSIHVRRKCWKERIITVDGFGKLSLGRRQLSCVDCNGSWMPYEDALRLPTGAFDRQSISKSIDRVTEQSYKKAGDACPSGPSGSTIHRRIQRLSPPEVDQNVDTLAVDGTRIPAWKKPGQITVSLLHEIASKEPMKSDQKRPKRRNRRILGVVGGREADVVAHLKPLRINALVHDGNIKLDDLAVYVGRCRWHVPYTVKYLLYRDEIRGKENNKRVEGLKNGLERHKADPKKLVNHLEEWVRENKDAPVACTHVSNSKEALLTMSRNSDEFTTHTTSHMEREMVEINKRFENGGGWTSQGAESLLWFHQLKRFEPEKYTQTKHELFNNVAFSDRRNSLS